MIDSDHIFGIILYALAWSLACVPAACGGLAFVLVKEIRRCNGEAQEYAAPAFILCVGISIGAAFLNVALPLATTTAAMVVAVAGGVGLTLGFGALAWAGLQPRRRRGSV